MSTHTAHLDTLMSHDRWLRGLVRRLVAPDQVDDVLQETWIRAAQNPPGGAGRQQRAWLARVAGNFARRTLRDERSRARRDRAVHRDTVAPATDVLVAKLDEQRRVATAVSALAEPYRSTILMHFMEGWSTKEIARRTGTPWATVWTRLSRGIELLRRSFDAEEDAAWRDRMCLAVFGVPLARLDDAPRDAVMHGIASSSSRPLLLAAAGLIVTAAVVLYVAGTDPTTGSTPAPRPAPEAPRLAAAEPVVTRDEPTARTTVGASDAPLATRVRGVVLGTDGRPLDGVAIGVLGSDDELGQTDAAGVFQVVTTARQALQTTGGHVALYRSAEDQIVRLIAAPVLDVRGRVVDARGHPIAGAEVQFEQGALDRYPASLAGWQSLGQHEATRADALGLFVLRRLPWIDGSVVSARVAGHVSAAIPFGLASDQVHSIELVVPATHGEEGAPLRRSTPLIGFAPVVEIELVLHAVRPESAWTLVGRIFDAEGAPVPGAEVKLGSGRTRSGPDGRYELVTTQLTGTEVLRADGGDRGAVCLRDWSRNAASGRGLQFTVDLLLAPRTAVLAGRIVTPAGVPLAARTVHLLEGTETGARLQLSADAPGRAQTTGEEGRFRLTGLTRGMHRLCVIDPASYQVHVSAPLATGAFEHELVVPVAHPRGPHELRTVDANGRAIPGARLDLCLDIPLPDGKGSHRLGRRSWTLDAEGRATLPAFADDEHLRIDLEAPGFVPRRLTRDELASGAPLTLDRLVELHYAPDGPWPTGLGRELRVLDEHGEELFVRGPWREFVMTGTAFSFAERPPVIETSERARTLVIGFPGGVQRTLPIAPRPGAVTRVR